LYRFRDITTFYRALTVYDLEKSFSFKTVTIKTYYFYMGHA